jgi:hypothetical protein
MSRKLAITLVLALACGACASLPFMKGGPETSFIVYSSDNIGELKPCG